MPGRKRVHPRASSLTVARPEMGEPTLSVGEIAKKLQTVAPDISATIERIRHWTRENILLPVDQHHAGTGKHRRYSNDTVLDAAILTVVANLGLPIVSHGYLVDALPRIRRALRNWDQSSPVLLEISRGLRETSSPVVMIHKGNANPSAEISLMINLKVFGRILKDLG